MNRIARVLFAVLFMGFSLPAARSQTPTPPPARTRAQVTADRTNLRAQPSADAEILGSLQKGDLVEVVGEVTSNRPKEVWSRVVLPASVTVWAYGPLVDKSGRVKGEILNYRAGPGRNYSVLGQISRGDRVTVIREFDGWLQIEAPAGAVAYVASRLLDTNPPPSTAPVPAQVSAPAPTPTTATPTSTPPAPVPDPETKVTPALEPPPTASSEPAITPAPAAAPPPPVVADSAPLRDSSFGVTETSTVVTAAASAPPAQATDTPDAAAPPPNSTSVSPERPIPTGSPRELAAKPAPKSRRDLLVTSSTAAPLPMPEGAAEAAEARVVTREGIVRATLSPQAPSDYELRDGFYQEGLINYLYLVPQKDLRKFSGKRVKVTGKETLDSRWRTPVLLVETIELAP